jgi:hypothetical protein
MVGSRNRKLQESAEGCRRSLVHGRARCHFDGLQIQIPALTSTVEDCAQQLLYFARDLLLDRFRRFFSSGEMVSSTGRARQILSFTCSNS